MYSSTSLSSLYVQSSTRLLYDNKPFRFSPNPFLFRPRSLREYPLSAASIAERNLQLSWSSSDRNAPDDYNGWAVVEAPVEEVKKKKKKGFPTFVIIGVGASVATLLGFIIYITLSRKGFEFRLGGPLNALHKRSELQATDKKDDESHYVGSDESLEKAELSEATLDSIPDMIEENRAAEVSLGTEKGQLGRIIIPYAVDSTQQEALTVLKKLKIIEDDVKADELCTRREYARWLVRVNSQLERNRKHRITPSVTLCGSTVAAFGDVSIQDPDFGSIQSLAEAGIVSSKLSPVRLALDDQEVNFSPERFISRQDLICWKIKLEYEVIPGIDQEVSRKNVGFLDLRDIGSEALVDLFMDILADEKSILRRVFGQSKRFQPSKPSTKAQAAVALTSGRMMELINAELSRLEVETTSRQTAMEEIRSELLERGDIQKYWERKLEDERSRALKVEEAYLTAINDLEKEKIVQENAIADLLKQKAALECQKQLLSSLKDEVNEMSERLEIERAKNMNEQLELQDSLRDLQVKHEGLLDAKSILEAEIEALRILRSWIEDEARKSQSRAKTLEEAGRRWRWDKQSPQN